MKSKIILSSTIKVVIHGYVIYSEFGEHYKKKNHKQMLNIYNPLIWMCIYDYKSSQMENIQ